MTARTAPTLRAFVDDPDSRVAGKIQAARELRALLAEVRLSRRWWGTPVEMIPDADRVRMTRLRLTRAPRGAGKRRGR